MRFCRKKGCLVFVSLLLAFILLFSSCTSELSSPASDLSLTDALDRQVTVPEKPLRVAALLGSFADVWCLAGGSLVAAPRDAWEDFELSKEGVVDLGGAHSPSLEALLSSSPDLVLASASTASHVALLESLEAAGIAVIYFDVDCFADYLSMLRVCTEITGRDDLYQKNGLALQEQIAGIKAAFSSANLSPEKRTVLLLRVSSGGVKAKGSRGTVLGEMLADIGCVNIADSDKTLLENLSVEAVIREDPYRIFIVPMGDDSAALDASLSRMMVEDPAWGSVAAICEGRMHRMDKTLFNLKPNDRWGEAYEKLYEILAN